MFPEGGRGTRVCFLSNPGLASSRSTQGRGSVKARRVSAPSNVTKAAVLDGKCAEGVTPGRLKPYACLRVVGAYLAAMNKDQKDGSVQNIKGRVKEAGGALTADKRTQAEGLAERVAGAAKKAVGDVKHEVSKKLDR
jgi:uncharacterized protein YjbJ (UPF0337 family)